MLGCIGTNQLVPCLIALAGADEYHSMSRRLLRQFEAALTLVYSLQFHHLQLMQVLKIWIVRRLQLSSTRNFQRHLHIQRLQLEAGQTADIRHFNHT